MDDLYRKLEFDADAAFLEVPAEYDENHDTLEERDGALVALRGAELLGDLRVPQTLSDERAAAIGHRVAHMASRVAYLKHLLKEAQDQCQKHLKRMEGWYGPALVRWAQGKIGNAKPRQYVADGSLVKLRRQPVLVKLVDIGEFKRWDRANPGAGLSKRVARFTNLTVEELDEVVEAIGACSDAVQQKFSYSVELKAMEARKYLKATGEIPGGTDVIDPGDKVYFETHHGLQAHD